MQEVTIQLRYTKPALGFVERRVGGRVYYALLRDVAGRVVFLPTWWRTAIDYAAKVLNRYQGLVTEIDWGTTVEGVVKRYRRHIVRQRGTQPAKRHGYAEHEAFLPGEVICVRAVLPTGLSPEAMAELLAIVGRYKGVSPYRVDQEAYGTFDVVAVQSGAIPAELNHGTTDSPLRQHD